MVDIPISRHNIHTVHQWCEKHISPRSYWMHNKIGGPGWILHSMPRNEQDWRVAFNDDHDAIVFKLSVLLDD
jgi:hypothetical protein